MNLTFSYVILLLAIIIFFIFFYVNFKLFYKNKNNINESFQCAEDLENSFLVEIDKDLNACFNFFTEHYTETSNGNSIQFFKFDGARSFVYIKDFLDNLFNLELFIKIRNENVIDSVVKKTIINSKFLKIYFQDSKLKILYNNEYTQQFQNNIEIDAVYHLKILQTSDKIEVIFRQIDEDINTRNKLIFNTVSDQKCDFSSNNDIYIGCNKSKGEYLEAHIGNIKVSINKDKYNEFMYSGGDGVIPDDLSCDNIYQEPEIPQPFITVPLLDEFDKTGEKIQIYLSNTINDFRIKYKKLNNIPDRIQFLNRGRITQIKDVFSTKLIMQEEIITNQNRFILEKSPVDNFFSEGYDNLKDNKDYIMYLFDLKKFKNQNIVEKFKFLDLKKVKRRMITFDETHLLIYGEKTSLNSYFKFLRLQKPIFFIIYKNESSEGYFYEQLNINLDIFYEFHKNYLIHIINNGRTLTEELEQYESYINSLEVGLSLNIDDQTNTLIFNNEVIEYTKNFFRLYNNIIDLGISASIYSDNELVKTVFVNYKDNTVREQCRFLPSGQTIYDCISECKNSNFFACGDSECKSLCNNCTNRECEWNLVDIEKINKFKPSSINIKGFAGDKQIKLTWIKPLSSYPITKYYIILENIQSDVRFDMYVYDGEEELIEYVISDLNNNIPYKFYVFSQSSAGVSDVSNSVTIIPQKNKLLETQTKITGKYSDSLQSYNKAFNSWGNDLNLVNIDRNIIALQNIQELNDLQQILVNKIYENNNSNNLNINIF